MGVEDKLDKAKVNIAGIEGEFTVAKVKGMLEDEADVEESNKGTTPMLCTIYSCSGRTCSARTYVPLVRVRCLRLGFIGLHIPRYYVRIVCSRSCVLTCSTFSNLNFLSYHSGPQKPRHSSTVDTRDQAQNPQPRAEPTQRRFYQ